MQRRSLLAAIGALLAGGLRTDTTAKTASSSMPESRFIAWPVFAKTTPGIPTLNGHTDTVPDIVGRIQRPRRLHRGKPLSRPVLR